MIKATMGGVVIEDVTALPIKNSKSQTIGTLVLEEVSSDSPSAISAPLVGYIETKAVSTNKFELPIGDINATEFFVSMQLVETGKYATANDSNSELTMDESPTGRNTSDWLFAGIEAYTSNASCVDENAVWGQTPTWCTGITYKITTANKMNQVTANDTISYSNGKITVSPALYVYNNMYCKFKYAVYPLAPINS